jgi:hypothetical protein
MRGWTATAIDAFRRKEAHMQEADETTTGLASIMLEDPDGNPILLDQHV